jgi:DNA-binding transcriptional MerR regulator
VAVKTDLLSIGAFAALSGLSIPTLRHYDEVGILKPAYVDPQTNYRFYRSDQVGDGSLIRALRAVDLPIDVIRDVLEAGDESYVREILRDHRDGLASRAHVLSQQLEALDEYIEKGVLMPPLKGNRIVMLNLPVHDPEAAKTFYEQALGVEFAVDRHADDDPGHYAATFGEWPDTFFLMQLIVDEKTAGTANYGFFCEDLDSAYKKSLEAGAEDLHGPKDVPGMPRNAYVRDPSGNILGLYQA